jgi:hypothetical protein
MKAMILLLIGCIAIADSAPAATNVKCVGNSSDLTQALSTLSNSPDNIDADEIRIRTGTYFAPAGGWSGSVTTHHDLSIRGGYTNAGCTLQTMDASMTVLDGNNASGVMTINTPGLPVSNIEVSGLTFQNGNASNPVESNAGGLKIGDPNPINEGKIIVERNIFRHNRAASNGFSRAVGGLLAATDGLPLIVRGNLFVDNTSPNDSALDVESNNEIDVSNNTFSGNRSTDATQPTRVAMGHFTFTGIRLSNNVFWNNTAGAGEYDLNFSGVFNGEHGAKLANNDIQASTGTAVAETGTLHIDPGFVGNGNFHLADSSPLINAGIDNPAGDLANVDLDGAPRIAGSAVDLGAYENSSPAAGPRIGPGFSGNWSDPTPGQEGHGFQIEVLPDHGVLVIWFVFNPAGTAQTWIYTQGSYDPSSSSVTLAATLETGGRFPPNFNSSTLTRTPWGLLTLTFTDCNNGTVAWASNAASAAAGYGDVSFPIRRVTSIAGTSCP